MEVKKLKDWCFANKITLTELANKADVNTATVWRVTRENSRAKPLISTLVKLTEPLGIQPEQVEEFRQYFEDKSPEPCE